MERETEREREKERDRYKFKEIQEMTRQTDKQIESLMKKIYKN